MRRSTAGLALAALLVTAGCARLRPLVPSLPASMQGRSRISQVELREALADYAARFAAVVGAAADEIRQDAREAALRRRTLLWKIRMVPLVQEAAFSSDAREGYLAVLTLTVLQRQYLTEGDGRGVFAELQPIADRAARELEDEALRVGTEFLAPSELERATREVEAFAQRRPMRGREFDVQALHVALTEVHTSHAFAWVLDVPMSPFRALEGVSSGAQAIHEFNQTAAGFAKIVEGIPQQLRWQSELLLYDVEERDTLVEGLAAFQSVAESAARASLAVEALPDDLRATLSESEGALARANEVIASAQALVEPLEETALHVREAGAAWAGIVRQGGEPRGEGRPFDVTEWESAAREIGSASARLAELTAELRSLVESRELDTALAGVSGTVERAEAGAQTVVDAAAWRGLQLLLAFFALLVAYRLLSPLLPGARR